MEKHPVNGGYRHYPYREDQKVENDIKLWEEGQTGIPIIDACMRSLKYTGYLNFRMRAMMVSFVCHHLNIAWQRASCVLSRYFLDFEPGIHYPQIQMQASVTGINTIRLYNPIKQSKERDPEGIFIRRWCPELAPVALEYLHEPWRQPPMEAIFCGFGEELNTGTELRRSRPPRPHLPRPLGTKRPLRPLPLPFLPQSASSAASVFSVSSGQGSSEG